MTSQNLAIAMQAHNEAVVEYQTAIDMIRMGQTLQVSPLILINLKPWHDNGLKPGELKEIVEMEYRLRYHRMGGTGNAPEIALNMERSFPFLFRSTVPPKQAPQSDATPAVVGLIIVLVAAVGVILYALF